MFYQYLIHFDSSVKYYEKHQKKFHLFNFLEIIYPQFTVFIKRIKILFSVNTFYRRSVPGTELI